MFKVCSENFQIGMWNDVSAAASDLHRAGKRIKVCADIFALIYPTLTISLSVWQITTSGAITLNNEITPTGDDNTFDDSTPPQDFNDDGGSAGFLTGLLALLVLRRRRGTAPC